LDLHTEDSHLFTCFERKINSLYDQIYNSLSNTTDKPICLDQVQNCAKKDNSLQLHKLQLCKIYMGRERDP
jgi:hypothetical protein